jgi:hypothetical protein
METAKQQALPVSVAPAPRKPPNIFTPLVFLKIHVVDSAGFRITGLKNAVFPLNPLHGRFAMKYLITGLIISTLSATAMAGSVPGTPVEVPEPGMLGLFAASVAALFIARKFRK